LTFIVIRAYNKVCNKDFLNLGNYFEKEKEKQLYFSLRKSSTLQFMKFFISARIVVACLFCQLYIFNLKRTRTGLSVSFLGLARLSFNCAEPLALRLVYKQVKLLSCFGLLT